MPASLESVVVVVAVFVVVAVVAAVAAVVVAAVAVAAVAVAAVVFLLILLVSIPRNNSIGNGLFGRGGVLPVCSVHVLPSPRAESWYVPTTPLPPLRPPFELYVWAGQGGLIDKVLCSFVVQAQQS